MQDNYSPGGKLLHYLALGHRFISEASFDIEQLIFRVDASAYSEQTHVFISGLARAGTTILMRRFYETGNFRSLTYRDMPFVLMPNLWGKLSSTSGKKMIPEIERAHGDGVLVNFDSPEALDEVFWRVFTGREYIRTDRLVPYEPTDDELERFQKYVGSIILSAENPEQKRYLSKNNNNILRLPSIRKAFPNALIIVPFRDPIQHALSLQRQHEHFWGENQKDAFSASYMNWLGHHEFGLNHRPFVFSSDDIGEIGRYETSQVEYWLTVWTLAYRFLVEHSPSDSIFLSYEALCHSTVSVWNRLEEVAKINKKSSISYTDLKLSYKDTPLEIDQGVLKPALEVFNILKEKEDNFFSKNN